MKKFIIFFTITGMLAMASCGNGSESPKTDSTCVDSCKKDTTAVNVDTLATKTDTTSKK